ncbi:Tripartite motif-containing protein 60 [Cercospora zeina]
MLSSDAQSKTLDGLDSWKYQILFGVWLGGTAMVFHRIRRQPFRQAVKVEQYETAFKSTSLAATVAANTLLPTFQQAHIPQIHHKKRHRTTNFVRKNMTTLAQFLASGLTPMELSQDDAECPICFESLDDKVSVTCGHVFCRACISTWAQSPSNTCPTCRSVLYEELPRTANVQPITDDWNRISNLATTYNADISNTTAPNGTAIDPYELAVFFLRNRQAHTTDGVLRIIRHHNGQSYTFPIVGRGVFPAADRLRGPIRALASLIRARAQISGGRAWNDRRVAEWNEVIGYIETIVRAHEHQTHATVSRISAGLLRDLHREWRRSHGRRAVLSDFLSPDLDQLTVAVLDFVAYLAYKEARAQAQEDSNQLPWCSLM